jgi:hypothetical protein
MLQSLMTLSDEEVDLLIRSVHRWCALNNVSIDSSDGRRAITVAIELMQSTDNPGSFPYDLSTRLDKQHATHNPGHVHQGTESWRQG